MVGVNQMIVYPAVEDDSQALGMTRNMQAKIDCLGEEISQLEKELKDKGKARPRDELSDEELIEAAARVLKAATRVYAKESSEHVSRQRTEEVELESIDPTEEYWSAIPDLLRRFLEALSR